MKELKVFQCRKVGEKWVGLGYFWCSFFPRLLLLVAKNCRWSKKWVSVKLFIFQQWIYQLFTNVFLISESIYRSFNPWGLNSLTEKFDLGFLTCLQEICQRFLAFLFEIFFQVQGIFEASSMSAIFTALTPVLAYKQQLHCFRTCYARLW